MCSDARTAPPTRSSLAAWLCLPLLSILAGCSFAAVSDGQDASDLGASQSALVTVERTQDGAKTVSWRVCCVSQSAVRSTNQRSEWLVFPKICLPSAPA